MDCLFIKEGLRGRGIGKTVMDKIKELASAENYFCVQWQTPEFNERAISFYKREGATQKKSTFFPSYMILQVLRTLSGNLNRTL